MGQQTDRTHRKLQHKCLLWLNYKLNQFISTLTHLAVSSPVQVSMLGDITGTYMMMGLIQRIIISEKNSSQIYVQNFSDLSAIITLYPLEHHKKYTLACHSLSRASLPTHRRWYSLVRRLLLAGKSILIRYGCQGFAVNRVSFLKLVQVYHLTESLK